MKAQAGAAGIRALDWPAWRSAGLAFARGIRDGSGLAVALMPLALRGRAAAVVSAGSDPDALRSTLEQLSALPLEEIVVVLGEAPEALWFAARQHPNAVVTHVPQTLDPGIGRALGAKLTGEDIVLFADGSMPVPAVALASFLWRCDGGMDAALNDCASRDRLFHQRGEVPWMKEFLNMSLGRPDLKTNSLDALPFALSRTALDAVGASVLAVPPRAHAALLVKGLKVGIGGRTPRTATAEELAAGDHAEAWREAITAKGPRLHYQDKVRNRSVVGGVVHDTGIHPYPVL
ncbi:family 2 glycosyl transferase [Cohnella nanjingensis]|uniref:family 2 glycosyl transferase n=1 Tax=Cohnella nanjingensis TaxID=1387779 RepID=UPI001C879607|nr:family 2 glycosyl transferase [Cohnella nanjingensis]